MPIRNDLLILEDDSRIQKLLAENFKDDFTLHIARRVYEARKILQRYHIDLVCLDIMLPDGNGLDFCSEIKTNHPDTKIIVLSKMTSSTDRVKSFDSGVDDYLPKPFFPEELRARVKRLLKTDEKLITSIYSKITLDPQKGEVQYRNMTVILPPTQILVMEYLLKTKGFKDHESILKYLNTKRDKSMNKEALVVLISRMRQRFERNIGMKIIKTRYMRGYYLAI